MSVSSEGLGLCTSQVYGVRTHFRREAPGREAVQVEVLGLDHLAVAAVDPLEGDGIRGIALDQALHLETKSSTLQEAECVSSPQLAAHAACKETIHRASSVSSSLQMLSGDDIKSCRAQMFLRPLAGVCLVSIQIPL